MKLRVALLAALVSSVGLVCSPIASANPTARRVGCNTSFDLPAAECGYVSVPVDRSGAVPGRVKLFYELLPAAHKPKSTIAVFPGGPGAATSILGFYVQDVVKKSLADHDLLLLDQRGTGRSQYLNCDKDLAAGEIDLLIGDDSRIVGKGVQRCAKKIGAKRAFYTTRDTVADIEDVRQALSINKFVLLGVSYGTRDAMAYARAFPERTDRIVLDSLVSDAGLDAFGLHTVQALPLLLSVKSPKLAVCALLKLFKTLFPQADLRDDIQLAQHAFSTADQVATLCEESSLPWPRDSLPSERGRYAEQALGAMPDSAFAPFDRATVLSASLVSACKFWPEAPDAPATASGPLPNVPTMILAGLDDLRTPAEDAIDLANSTPGS